mmetsp:Transcript_27378/g.46919  ORF Transcript_27378/g.46919 Transcript_27378/m.46919 type:complete len:101 (+) Transcript_27378:854-1156(+)
MSSSPRAVGATRGCITLSTLCDARGVARDPIFPTHAPPHQMQAHASAPVAPGADGVRARTGGTCSNERRRALARAGHLSGGRGMATWSYRESRRGSGTAA